MTVGDWASIVLYAVTGGFFGRWQGSFAAGGFCFLLLMSVDFIAHYFRKDRP